MGFPFKIFLGTKAKLKKFRGKKAPISYHSDIYEILDIYQFPSDLPHYPLFYFQAKRIQYIGITLARQSSDFVKLVAKKILRDPMLNKFSLKTPFTHDNGSLDLSKTSLLEYHFPRDNMSLKLILLVQWLDLDQYEAIEGLLKFLQKEFIVQLKNLVKKM